MANYKTPGVYVQEQALLPNSVAEVSTAIPAFIGYTDFASDEEQNSLHLVPKRIKSLLEFETFFGKGYFPDNYTVYVNPDGPAVTSVTTKIRFYLYRSLQLFFDNGGGDCFIVSVGTYSEAVTDGIGKTVLEKGIDAISPVDEPTLILFPDAAGIEGEERFTDLGQLHQRALSQCARLGDRFAILDLMDGYRVAEAPEKPVEMFREKLGMNHLAYGAAYYPWLLASFVPVLKWEQLKFLKKGSVDVFDPAVDMASDEVYKSYLIQRDDFTETDKMFAELLGEADGIQHALDELVHEMEGAEDEETRKQQFSAYLQMLSGMAIFLVQRGESGGEELKKVVHVMRRDKKHQEALKTLIGIEKNSKITGVLNENTMASVKSTYQKLDKTEWLGNMKFSEIPADETEYAPGEQKKVITELENAGIQSRLIQGFQKVYEASKKIVTDAENTLLDKHPFFSEAAGRVKEMMRFIPPSGAIAGIYSLTDRNRGVWKAPANVSINSVVGPAVKLDNKDQESLNIHPTGKSINAIRTFTGRGVLVWGSRTLAGNDNEWKYIPVRRFFNMVEESIKKASEPYIFELNDKNTWVKVKAMIENYLLLQWRSGALNGALPDDAFYVKVGLGETMTASDIAEGRMIVEAGLAVARPSEFIVLRFSHNMILTSNSSI